MVFNKDGDLNCLQSILCVLSKKKVKELYCKHRKKKGKWPKTPMDNFLLFLPINTTHNFVFNLYTKKFYNFFIKTYILS